jgi:outer membrane protein assembly factor BamA
VSSPTPAAATDPSPLVAPSPAPRSLSEGAAAHLNPRRMEYAGFPIIAGNTDIGVQFGGAATITRFFDDVEPYLWNIDILLSASAKSDQNGFRFIQQSHVLRLDAPGLLGGRLRIDTRANFERTINAGWYGLGNASNAEPAAGESSIGRRYQFIYTEAKVRTIARVHVGLPFDLAFAGNLRYVSPEAYDNSKLTEDAAATDARGNPLIHGLTPTALLGASAGIIYDTRDSEFVTHKGMLYQIGVRASAGTSSEDLRYGEFSAVLANYLPVWGPFYFANRTVVSLAFGNTPFYDLGDGGPFEPQSLLGGDNGVRGVPQGRYAGLARVVTNIEMRATGPRFTLIGQRLRIGSTTFLDLGRVWNDYKYDPVLDGKGLGLKYGVGAGLFLQWGEAAIFRVEAAYSPDAVSENPGFPFGIYVSDGLMF